MVAGGFAGAVGAAGVVGCLFSEERQVALRRRQRIWVRQVAIDFIGADVVKAKTRFARSIQRLPIGAGGFEQGVAADDIGLDEVTWAIYGTIHMALSGQVHDRIRLMLSKNEVERGAVANIGLHKSVTRTGAAFGQRFKITRVGEFVDIHHRVWRVANDVAHQR